jgi:hypothetical protein
MLTREQVLAAERTENAQHQRIHETFAKRAQGSAAYAAWKEACRVWHSTKLPTDYLWDDDFRRRLRAGEREAVEDAILYLEVDPWCFRSGYLKQRLTDDLKRVSLTEHDRERLRCVMLGVARGRNRREFRHYCRLAVAVENEAFLEQLEREARDSDSSSRGKLAYLLRFLKRHGRLGSSTERPT